MSDLINRNDIYKLFEHGVAKLHVSDIDAISTVDAEPVRHGHWVKSKDRYHRCSVCESRGSAIKARYCHHCGAKMDEVIE